MAIVLDLVTSGIGNGPTMTYSHEVRPGPAGRLLVVTVQLNGADVTGVTYNGVSMDEQVTVGQSIYSTWIFVLENPDLGSHDVVVSTTSADVVSGAFTFHGVDTDNPIDATASNSGTTDPITITFSDRRVGQVIIDAVVAQATLIVAGAGQTQHYLRGLGAFERGGVSTEPGVLGDVVMSWPDVDAINWAIAAMALNPEPKAVEGVGAQFGPQVIVRRPAGVVY